MKMITEFMHSWYGGLIIGLVGGMIIGINIGIRVVWENKKIKCQKK